MLDVQKIRQEFPILKRKINGKPLVYLDNAASSQKPRQVIDAIVEYYEQHNANVHRGIHTLSEESSEIYENTRVKVANFIGAELPKQIIFTSGTTESLNLVAFGGAIHNIKPDQEILITNSEHHSNLLPWQMVAKVLGMQLTELDTVNKDLLPALEEKMTERVKMVIVSHASNVTGAINPIKEISKLTKKAGAKLVVDGAQAVPHMKVNMQSLGCDYYAFSAHKMLGPTGVGVLYLSPESLKELGPYKVGGGMIEKVDINTATWAEAPEKYEAGTPNIAGVAGFSAAIDYLNDIGMENIRNHEIELNKHTLETLGSIPDLHILGSQDPEKRTGLVSFHIDGVHAHDVAAVLNTEGIAVRSGQHCAMPLHHRISVSASTRASYYLYNTQEEINKLASGIKNAIEILK